MFYSAGVRDYIHVVDLAAGHVVAIKKFDENCGCKVYFLTCAYIVLLRIHFTQYEICFFWKRSFLMQIQCVCPIDCLQKIIIYSCTPCPDLQPWYRKRIFCI